MRNYRYNYGFLSQWMKDNKKNKTAVVKALGTQAYESVRRWMSGEMPMPVEAMLRLCNTYDIPLSCFFLELDTLAQIQPRKARPNDLTEPTGGRRAKAGRGRSDGMIDPEPLFRETSEAVIISPPEESNHALKEDFERLKLELYYEKKINELNTHYREREDKLRHDYEQKLESRDALLEEQRKEIERLREHARKDVEYRDYGNIAADKAPLSHDGF